MVQLKSRLIADWQWVLKFAWSSRLMLIAAVLTAAEALLPLLTDLIPRGPLAILSTFVIIAAFIARFVAQPRKE